jgi:magnesium-transporting ATPase (P-type)
VQITFARRHQQYPIALLVEDLAHHRSLLICKGAVEEMLAVSSAIRQGETNWLRRV